MKINRELSIVAVVALSLVGAACGHKIPVAQAPKAPEPVASNPTVPTPPPAPRQSQAPAETPRAAQTPRSDYPDAATQKHINELLARIQDAYFDYDKHTLRGDAVETLKANAHELGEIVKQYPAYKMQIQGFCDERGSAEYNLALGEKRAETARQFLVDNGVPSNQLSTISYGKEQQVCADHDESCWQKNRRVHITAMAR